ncbi:C2 domain-containing protein [Myriangium duriaei CBS 260.36]|uniref:C2 domain-containing protein n=1 Tax=Myriangium duriaei CBS 260.36 TaxID=1168546 RepID=A0A9P4ME18_9PEZI|nr:C2 domain-containing protein [Myriangium duriaei CBS 260.36]
MSVNSTHSPISSRRKHNASLSNRVRREQSYSKRKHLVTDQEAYSFALRAALITHLLQPRARRLQHVAPAPATKPVVQRSSTSINDLVKDFSLIRDSKSTRFPHGFPAELDKRITGVLVGKERMPEYNDPLVKRTFAAFLNEFKNPVFRKSAEKDRRVEDLLLIFFSKATSELQKGKAQDDDHWKLMVDRHVALFVRLISSTLKSNDWSRDRPELATRLQDLESKLLVHSQDLAHTTPKNGTSSGTTIEVEVPVSYEVKDMPGALRVANIFGKTYDDVQADIDANKAVWTPEAALKDLKLYQMHLSLNSTRTLNRDDFAHQDVYEVWKKAEVHDLTQMMLAIIQAYPELAKTSSTTTIPAANNKPLPPNPEIDQELRRNSTHLDDVLHVDISNLGLSETSTRDSFTDDDTPFVFIPPEPRAYYAAVLRKALSNDIVDEELQPSTSEDNGAQIKLLSKQSTEVLNEIALRWRVPQFSRLVLFLDVIRDKFQNREISLETLDQAFIFIKEPQIDSKSNNKTGAQSAQENLFDRSRWTSTDTVHNQEILSSIHDMLLRELYDLMQFCYESKPPSVGPVMFILENHIYDDPLFSRAPEDLDGFTNALEQGLQEKAREAYTGMLSKQVPEEADRWEFFHVIQLGKAVVALCDKIQKRYRKNPSVMGVSPLTVLVQQILPSFAADARDLVKRVMELARGRNEEVPVEDGFDLYRELVQIRGVHAQALPDVPFGFRIEDLLAEFVWRWIALTDSKMNQWVEEAVKQDDFKPKSGSEDVDSQRHTSSALDMFRSFNQSIDQIANLEWDDDLQYAKFMTAISKSIGAAVCRYCELLENKFVREMDKPTPEQEAGARQTTQEKWMQMARETLASKEKVEPFQFVPETLVKLNNIEYTTVNLDKLEKEINVDACADIIQKNTPPVPKTRQPTKFVFTIKIIEGEDLKACDMNGLSDPYVVLGDEYQKRLAKTRIISATLNPRWDETVDIITSGPLNIIATIWDWDALGDHDCVGRTTLKLDPSHFNDFLPKEYWLDLDTQGRLLLRVSMEGERDDIQFHFGKTFRQLKRTERDMTRKITDKLLAYIQQCLSRRALRTVLGQGISVSSVRALAGGYFQRAQGRPPSVAQTQQQVDPASALKPLFEYFDENFAIMKQTLTDPSMLMVMTRLWKEVLTTLESLLVPPLSDKPSQQRPLTSQEVDVVYKWLRLLFDFFHVDGDGVPLDVLRSPKYHDLQNLNFFYFESTENLIRTSERMASQTMARQQTRQDSTFNNRLSAPAASLASPFGIGGSISSGRRAKSVMLSRNLGTIKKVKEEKRKEAQAEPSDDMILRILRMRPEAERYLKDRSRQKERLAAHAAAEMIVRQSILAQRNEGLSRGRH